MKKTLSVLGSIGLVLLAAVVVLVILALSLAFQAAFIAGGAWLAMVVAGWFGAFAGVGWSTYFIIGVCLWAFCLVVALPNMGQRAWVTKQYSEHKAEKRAERKAKREAKKQAELDRLSKLALRQVWRDAKITSK